MKLLSLAFLFFVSALSGHAAQPNIILILIDDIGTGWIPPYADRLSPDDIEDDILQRYIEVRGHQGTVLREAHLEAARKCMPHLAKLADQGVVFDRAFATAALCAPSRAGLLTGSFQQKWGAYWNKDIDDHGIPAERTVIAEPLKAVGYRTGIVGKWHVAKQDSRFIERIWVEDLGEELPVHQYYKGHWPKISKSSKTQRGKPHQNRTAPARPGL